MLRFVVSGVLAAATNLGLTYLLERHSMLPYLAIVTIAVGTAIIVSFLLQKFFTFKEKSTARTHVQFAAFVGVAIANVFVTDLIVFLLVEFAGIRELVIDQIIAAIGVAAYSYFVYRHGIFKRRS